jgi:hypothetical protein
MGWGVEKNGNDRDGATALPETSPERSLAARAAGEFAGVTMGMNAGDSSIATLKLGGLDLVAIRGAPFKAPAARLGSRPPATDRRRTFALFGRKRPAIGAGKAAERALVAPARQFSPLVPTAESPCDDDDNGPMTRKRPKCDKLT